MVKSVKPKNVTPGIFFRAYGTAAGKPYPAWRYHKIREPVIVNNTDEDINAGKNGYNPPDTLIKRKPHLMNFMLDFEDMTPRQVVLFAKEEFGIDLPAEAGHAKLLKAIWRLTLNSPKNKDRIVLLAQSIRMNYDETLEEIKRVIETSETEEEREEIYV